MHIIRRFLSVCLLAFFVLSVTVSASESPVGTVLYRQTFDELSSPEIGGIRKGTDGADSFSLCVSDDALVIDNHGDRKSYTIFPCALPKADHTVEFTFSFDSISSSNAYVSFMLTSRGNAPDNITSVSLRANGDCEGFGKLSDKLTEKIASGERVSVKIPVENGDYYEMTVTAGGISETLSRKTVGSIPEGSIGFVVRNASVSIYEVAVMNGIGYESVTGQLKASSTWSDKNPYNSEGSTVALCDDVNVYNEAPLTGDAVLLLVPALLISAFVMICFIKRKI